MNKTKLRRQLKKQGYNRRTIEDYFRYMRVYKRELSFKDYLWEIKDLPF